MVPSSNLTKPTTLNLYTIPLTGRSLIEASAGTGKTYSLAFIYLRLLLGIGEHHYPRPLAVDEILVVTFTKAATEELRYRIRQNIHQLRIACLRDHPAIDTDYQTLIDLIPNKKEAIERLQLAEQYMDEAAIFTIHGFCQRMLTTYAFESGILFEQSLVKDETSLYLQVIRDFWRKYFNPLPEPIASIIWQHWPDPQALLMDIRPFLVNPLPSNITPSNQDIRNTIESFYFERIVRINELKQQWLNASVEIESIINQSGVSKRSYNKNHLPKWLNAVTEWAITGSKELVVPDELAKFSQAELDQKTDSDKIAPTHAIFRAIESLLTSSSNLRDTILFDMVARIKSSVQHEKQCLAQMGFDDLLVNLNQALQRDSHDNLAGTIAKAYPVAMIDEFQDTDLVQYQIFDRIYRDRSTTGLLLIGDPKQAIYGFRGADIFTYIKAKYDVDYQYTMTTNWRSSAKMVNAVSSLFKQHKNPFIFDAIPFIDIDAAAKNSDKQFYVNHTAVSALSCDLLPESITAAADYLLFAAEVCAEKIATWLSGQSYFQDHIESKRSLTSSDIAILVRTGREAEIIRSKLEKRGIKSVYVSNHHSVFESLEAREVLRILQAILAPANERYLRSALATQIIGVTMSEIETLTDDQNLWEAVVDEFIHYQSCWLDYGILVMLRRLINHRHIAENILSLHDGERILTNVMHLSEILQQTSIELDTPHALLRWLSKQINEPDLNLDSHEQRLASDSNLVQIITIHKSKGLEYPIVYLPFIGIHRVSDSCLYHNRATYNIEYAFDKNEVINELIEEERLAEDLRLLYVALTRSIYHCCIGLAGLKKGRSSSLTLVQSAIGFLLLHDTEEKSYLSLYEQLKKLNDTSINLVDLPVPITIVPCSESNNDILSASIFSRKLDRRWRVTSYSGLQQSVNDDKSMTNQALFYETLPTFDVDALADSTPLELNQVSSENLLIQQQQLQLQLNIHHFPKGALVGTLLHECFEQLDFTQPNITVQVQALIGKLNLDQEWCDPLTHWFMGVLSSPLNQQGLSLAKINRSVRLDELQFYLPIQSGMTAYQFDKISKRYDCLSKQCEPLNFMTVQGLLKGFIDMVFEWQGKYYIVDYKSNWLGYSELDYTQTAMEQAMCAHRYDLQYQLYSLALHRYLASRIVDYHYDRHFGGIYYLFVRGMAKESTHGIFYHLPQKAFIDELDQLFSQ